MRNEKTTELLTAIQDSLVSMKSENHKHQDLGPWYSMLNLIVNTLIASKKACFLWNSIEN